MNKLELGKTKAIAPSRLGELSESQLMDLATAFTYNYNFIDTKVFLASKWLKKMWFENERMIREVLKEMRVANKSQLVVLREILQDYRHHRVVMIDLFDWVKEPQTTDKWLITELTFAKFYIFNIRKFRGPSLRMGNITFWQWCQAEMNFFRFQKTQDRKFFNQFCACLYMPVKNDMAARFSDDMIEKHAAYFAKLTPVQVSAIRLNYVAIKSWLHANHRHVFVKSDSNEEVENLDMSELLLRTAKDQHQDESVIANKPLLVELKKLELAAKDFEDANRKR